MAQMTKEEATTKGKILCDTLKMTLGGNWQPRVHENLGWHFTAQLGSMNVYEDGKEEYSCLISDKPGTSGGLGIWTLQEHPTRTESPRFKKPAQAVKAAMAEANRVVQELSNVITNNTILMLS